MCEWNGTCKIGELLRTGAMADYRFWGWSGPKFRFVGAALPGNLSSDEEMGIFCMRTVNTI